MLLQYLLIFIGGGLGCVTRFLVYQGSATVSQQFPTGTLIINITGSFLIGLVFYIILEKFERYLPFMRAGLMLGFLGGYTTFSAFSLETLTLLQQGSILKAMSYIFVSVIGGVLATWCGLLLARGLLS